MSEIKYTGHGANTGGLQSHSIGDEFPFMVQGQGDPMKWVAVNLNTGEASPPRDKYEDCISDIALRRLRKEILQSAKAEAREENLVFAFILGFNAYRMNHKKGNPFDVDSAEYGRYGTGWHRAVAFASLTESAALNYH